MWSSARGVIDGAWTAIWSAAFRVAALVRPAATSRWQSPGGQRVLVIAPHPDDEVAGCAGTLVRHRDAGDVVAVVHVSDGRGSRAGGRGPDQMAACRKLEAQAAAAALGIEWEWLGLREWEWQDEELPPRLCALFAGRRPHIVYAPSRIDYHPEHVRVATAVAAALAAQSAPPPTVRVYQIQVPLTRLLVNLVVPVGTNAPQAEAAFRAYQSQAGSLDRCRRLRRYAAAAHGEAEGAEVFWELSAAAYIAVHAAPARRSPTAIYRGVRRLAVTDGLAFLRGRGERVRLHRQASGGS
jgi:LmbE family N-acetylglucosaminyl deacetylase